MQRASLEEWGAEIERAGRAIAERFAAGGRMYTFGNGGSSTDAETAFALQGLVAYPIVFAGSDVLKGRWILVGVTAAGIGMATRTIGRDGQYESAFDLDVFRKVLEVNLVGTFNVLRLAAAAMGKTEPLEHGQRGVVINTASIAAFDGQIGQVAYAASKAAVVGMTLPARASAASRGNQPKARAVPAATCTPPLMRTSDSVSISPRPGIWLRPVAPRVPFTRPGTLL